MKGPHFDGPAYDPKADHARLTSQQERLRLLMLDGKWRSLEAIADEIRAPAASVSAQLRHLRKPRFGSYVVERRGLGRGLFEYRVLSPGGAS